MNRSDKREVPLCRIHGTALHFEPDLCAYCDGTGEEPNTFLFRLRCQNCQGAGVPMVCDQCIQDLADALADEDDE